MNNELSPIFAFHILFGTVALLSGAAALIFKKGSRLHRQSGNVFVITMACMSLSGVYLAFAKPAYISVVAGTVTFYLVVTSWLTVYRKSGQTGRWEYGLLLLAIVSVVGGFGLGIQTANSELGYTLIDGFKLPPGVYYFFGGTAAFCALLDIRMLLKGGLRGVQRLARHLWRMCFAVYIAAASIFIGNPQVFPEAIRGTAILSAPVFTILIVMVFWLMRLLFQSKKYPYNLIDFRLFK